MTIPDGQAACALVVDDEPLIRMLIVDVLEEEGFVTHEAGDGPAALALLEGEPAIDVLITDVGLPAGMDGWALAETARRRRPDLKVVFVTCNSDGRADGTGGMEAGTGIVGKPFRPSELVRLVG